MDRRNETGNDRTIDYATAKAVIEAVAEAPAWQAPIDITPGHPGQDDCITVCLRSNGRYQVALPPVVQWDDIVSTIALVSLIPQADELCRAPGCALGWTYRMSIDGIADDCAAALADYRASAPAVFS